MGILSLAIAAMLLFVPSLVYANPISYDPFTMVGGFSFLFALEGLILGMLLGIKKIKWLFFIFTWYIVTLITWISLMIVGWSLAFEFKTYFPFIPGETAVILIEAYILKRLAASHRFMKEVVALPNLKSFFFSLIANATSFIGGFFVLALNRYIYHTYIYPYP